MYLEAVGAQNVGFCHANRENQQMSFTLSLHNSQKKLWENPAASI